MTTGLLWINQHLLRKKQIQNFEKSKKACAAKIPRSKNDPATTLMIKRKETWDVSSVWILCFEFLFWHSLVSYISYVTLCKNSWHCVKPNIKYYDFCAAVVVFFGSGCLVIFAPGYRLVLLVNRFCIDLHNHFWRYFDQICIPRTFYNTPHMILKWNIKVTFTQKCGLFFSISNSKTVLPRLTLFLLCCLHCRIQF